MFFAVGFALSGSVHIYQCMYVLAAPAARSLRDTKTDLMDQPLPELEADRPLRVVRRPVYGRLHRAGDWRL